MSNSAILKLVAVGAVLGAALSANAFYFNIDGTVDSSGAITSTTSEVSSLSEFGNNYTYFLLFDGGTGDLTFDVSNGASTADFTGSGSITVVNGNYGFSGTPTAISATNTSIQVGATGTYASNWDLNDGFFTFTLSGSNPVPEPATMTLLGLGAAALIRRRKK